MVELRKLCKKYNDQVAVDDLSMTIGEGELCVLLGKSGCGKSTTLRMINRLIEPTSGEIFVDGKNIREYDLEKFRMNVGYAVQNVGLFPHLTVENNIAIVPQLLKWDKEKTHARVEEMLDLVGLDVERFIHKHPSELSGGEAQRVGVARALAGDPEIVLMDEPFGAVDPINRARLQTEFRKIQKQLNKTVIFVTHDMEEAIRLGDKIAIMEKGVLKGYDVPEKIMLADSSGFIQDFLGKDFALKLLSRYLIADSYEGLKDANGDEGPAVSINDNYLEALTYMLEKSDFEIGVKDEAGTVKKVLTLTDICKLIQEV